VLLGWLVVACMGGADAEPLDEAAGSPTVVPAQVTATPARTAAAPAPSGPVESSPQAPASSPSATVLPAPSPTPTAIPTATLTPGAIVTNPSPTPAPAVAAPVIVIDPAHDPTSPGALGTEYREVLTTALYTKAALEEAGYIVHLTRYNNDTINQDNPAFRPPNADDFHPGYSRAYAQASAALQYDPDLVIVLHYNGIGDPAVGGIEVYYCEEGSDQNIVLAEILLEELVTAFRSVGYEPPRARVLEDLIVARGNRHFPSLGNVYDFPRTWLENRYDHIPVALTEPLYMTNPTEYALLSDPGTHMALADAYVRAIDRYFGRGSGE
jgi:N-acetylmuramoyl-L-alanine amidase